MNSGFTQLRIWVKKEEKARIKAIIARGWSQSISAFGRQAIIMGLDFAEVYLKQAEHLLKQQEKKRCLKASS